MTMMIKPRSTVEPHRQPWHFGPWLIQVKHLGWFFSGVTFKMPPEKWQNMPFLFEFKFIWNQKQKEKHRKEKSFPDLSLLVSHFRGSISPVSKANLIPPLDPTIKWRSGATSQHRQASGVLFLSKAWDVWRKNCTKKSPILVVTVACISLQLSKTNQVQKHLTNVKKYEETTTTLSVAHKLKHSWFVSFMYHEVFHFSSWPDVWMKIDPPRCKVHAVDCPGKKNRPSSQGLTHQNSSSCF